MKKISFVGILAALFLSSATLTAQEVTLDVDRTKYPDYSDKVNPDWSLMTPKGEMGAKARSRAASGRPDHVHNGLNRHFPPVFNQDGGSCGSASRICYMFSYELAAYRDLDGSDPHNYYPSHFVWLHTNSPSSPTDQGKDAFVTKVGVPSAATYGGQTYSSLFGNQEESHNDFGWMQGYDKWYEAMHNRMLKPSNFPVNVGTEEGREAVKNWLWNHNGDDSFQAGGICGIGVASGGVWKPIPKTDTNEKIGVAGMDYVYEWGTQVDHALTIVGYDDRIEFDIDKDGVYGEPEADELGAWIIVNSWGNWCNGGFIYCPYAFGGPAFNNDGNPGERTFPGNHWTPEIYRVRKDYRPLRTIKLEMDYSRRSEIALSAGVSADLNATEPESAIPFVHFSYAGDGNWGGSDPAPEIPMLGRWADGKLHTEPMEFGYDLTDLSAGYDMSQPLKYFFIVDSRSWAQGEGTIYNASIIDYRFNELGVETPFAIGEGVEVKNAGEKTIISVIVQGSGYSKPQNAAYADGTLTWQAPIASGNTVIAYYVYYNGAQIASLSADEHSYVPLNVASLGEYGVSAVYSDGGESECVTARIPLEISEPNMGVQFNNAGFTIPDVMSTHYENATIEFWLKPRTLQYWNQSGGPGWGTFMFHADGSGAYFAGWSDNDRAVTTGSTLKTGQWSHIAMVVEKNKIVIYVNGVQRAYRTSSSNSGVGGFGDLVFDADMSAYASFAQDGIYDEIRIWNSARTAAEIKSSMNVEFSGSVMPKGLIAYLRGDLISDDEGNQRLYDCVGGYHATLQGNYSVVNTNELGLSVSNEEPTISIDKPKGVVYAGIPATFSAIYNTAVNRIVWNAEDAGIENLNAAMVDMTFATAGKHTVKATAYTATGATVKTTCEITVLETPEVDATFDMTHRLIPAGERVTFHARNPQIGYIYKWSMPGADTEEGTSPSVAACYQAKGTYVVTLTVTAPNGEEKKQTEQIEVLEVAPKADFSIVPAVVVKDEEVELTDKSLYTPTQWEWRLSSENNNYIVYDQYKTLKIDKPGVYDVTLSVANSAGSSKQTRQRALIVTNADSKNGLLFSGSATVAVGMPPITGGQTAFTIDWWMNSGWPTSFCNGIGDSDETMIVKTNANGQLVFTVAGNSVTSSKGIVTSGEWHHYAVTYNAGSVKFYCDGMLAGTGTMPSGTKIPDIRTFNISSEEAPLKGSIDELHVWGKALTENQLRTYANAPITDVAASESQHALKLYYNFNQNGGDVKDATSNANHGRRIGFGPDGDAWGLSKGVFSLNFDATSGDITSTYFPNHMSVFDDNGKCINPALPTRAFAITGWTIENAVTKGNVVTGAHVDRGKNNCFTVTTGWDGFASSLSNHKVFRTMTLPAGYYTFETKYDGVYEGQCGNSYLVAAVGKSLPDTENLEQAISYTSMKAKGQATVNTLGFVLTQETTVSVGLLVNMSGNSLMAIQKFTLKKSGVTIFEKSSDAVPSITKLSNDKLYYVSLPYHKGGVKSWAIAQGGNTLKSNAELGVTTDRDDAMQQFAFLTNNEGLTHYLYHAAEKKFVGRDGRLTETPTDPICFKEGAYDTTFVAYFDEEHYINVDGNGQMVIDNYRTPDGGNSIVIRPAKTFNPKAPLALFPVVEVTEITLSHSSATLMAGDALALQATVNPSYATDPTVTWSTSDASVAIVVRGVVTAVAPGTATITAKAGGKEATCMVTVEKRYVAVAGVLMSQSTATVTVGDVVTLAAIVTPSDADDKTVTWETADASIATVEDGIVTGVAPGTVTITAKAGGRQATCVVTVKKRYVPVTSIVLNYSEVELLVGETVTLSATPLPEDADNKEVSWSSSNKDVATISRRKVKAKAPGTAIITAATADCIATCVVTVKESTGVEHTVGDESVLNIYDITGRPVKLNAKTTQGLDSGVYVINGRKVVVK